MHFHKIIEKIDDYKEYQIGKENYDEDIPIGPSIISINNAKEIAIKLNEIKILPFRVTLTYDSEMCLVFENNYKLLYLEFCDDREIVYSVINKENNKNQEKIEVKILNKNDITESVKKFMDQNNG